MSETCHVSYLAKFVGFGILNEHWMPPIPTIVSQKKLFEIPRKFKQTARNLDEKSHRRSRASQTNARR